MRHVFKLVIFLIIIGVVTLASGYWFGQQYWQRPNQADQTLFEVKRGSGFNQIVTQLQNGQLIDRPHAFKTIEILAKRQNRYQAGEFMIPANASPAQISDILRNGKSYQRMIQLIEGTTVQAFVQANPNPPGLTGEWPKIPEGSLLPDTYAYNNSESKAALVRRMQEAMRTAVLNAWNNRQPNLPVKSPTEAVILASIVEKETGLAAERTLVASVFTNRLRLPMRLQSDPTIIYGLNKTGSLGRGIKRSELEQETPYNTYKIDRLPPTAICNPSLASIKAVLNPADTNYLYFVADGSGGHAFSRSLAEHNSNVVNWRKLEKSKNIETAPSNEPVIDLPSPADLLLPQ